MPNQNRKPATKFSYTNSVKCVKDEDPKPYRESMLRELARKLSLTIQDNLEPMESTKPYGNGFTYQLEANLMVVWDKDLSELVELAAIHPDILKEMVKYFKVMLPDLLPTEVLSASLKRVYINLGTLTNPKLTDIILEVAEIHEDNSITVLIREPEGNTELVDYLMGLVATSDNGIILARYNPHDDYMNVWVRRVLRNLTNNYITVKLQGV